ncbi:glycosyltransferase family 9 protein [Geomonas subterranea]|uniref:glycosyltransferase family 9 protein n=1 Tax=Geomonas subterranea TaxID=2847989 RepID=UPI003461FEED
MRVLIIKPSSLGDVIQALPVLDYLHQAVPGIEVDWVIEESLQGVLAGHPQVSQVHSVPAARWRKQRFSAKTWRGVSALRKTLCERAYDLVFDLQGDLISGVISRYSGCADRLGFERDAVVEPLNTWCNTRLIPVRRQEYHNTDRCLRLVSIPFAKDFRSMELAAHLASSPGDEANAEALLATLADGLVFLFHHGTAQPTGAWSEKGWTELGREVLDRFHDATILLPWESETERQAAFSIAAAIGPGCRVLDRLSLKGMAALLKKVDLVVGGMPGGCRWQRPSARRRCRSTAARSPGGVRRAVTPTWPCSRPCTARAARGRTATRTPSAATASRWRRFWQESTVSCILTKGVESGREGASIAGLFAAVLLLLAAFCVSICRGGESR